MQKLVCVNGHDRCHEGPSDACPYCEKREVPMTKSEEALAKLKRDLEWRGPGGAKQGNLVLPRDLAEALVREMET